MYTLGTPNDLLETNSYTYGNSNWKDQLTAYNGQSITYDQIGNPLTYNNGTAWTFTWEHGRQLATMTSGTTTWTNTYNSDGLRTSRTNGTITYNYYYEGSQLTEVTGSNGNIWIFYDGNRPVIIKYGDTATYHYELNLQGDVIAILDSSGNRVVEYTYDAWGNILSISGSKKDDLGQANPLRYRGYVYDPETGMYYCQSRYYDPEIGRWLNADGFTSTGQSFTGNNMFAYCGNNPISRSDMAGNLWLSVLIVTVVATTVYDISQLMVKDDRAVTPSYTDNKESVQIANSNKIITPWVQFGYSVYLNYFSEYKDYFEGLSLGMTFEWFSHNVGAVGFTAVGAILGSDNILAYGERCKNVDIGPTIFDDSKEHGDFGTIMKAAYSVLFPVAALYDSIQYCQD